MSFLFAIKCAPSSAPVAANAQQDPHSPWSFTGVTAFLATQLKLSEWLEVVVWLLLAVVVVIQLVVVEVLKVVVVEDPLSAPLGLNPFILATNSSLLRSLNLFRATV